MFCTQCNTGFSWKTGRIETKIHNPHYFEWLRRTGGGEIARNPNDIQCGRNITNTLTRRIIALCRNNCTTPESIVNRILKICGAAMHMTHIDLPMYAVNHVLDNEDLRIDYLRQKITEEEFKTRIQRAEKKHQKKKEIHDVLTMLINTITDIIYRFHEHVDNISQFFIPISDDILKEVDEIVIYANECLSDISTVYNSKCYMVNENLCLCAKQ
jgi:Na+/phosphate symporter